MSDIKKILAKNKKALFEYSLEDKFEAGIMLKGSEVKSIRAGKISIIDAHAGNSGNEIYLYNCNIAEYEKANNFNHSPKRPRKLLLHKYEIKKIIGKIKVKGYTLITLNVYLNSKNKVKLELALARGKKLHDKRESIKQKDWQREQARIIREK